MTPVPVTATAWSPALDLLVEAELRDGRLARVGLRAGTPSDAPSTPPPAPLLRILEHLATGRVDLSEVPVVLEGTPFERAVLERLRAIPAGETATYGQIARDLGKPGASRAVGQACARNPLLLVIPCHRVVQGDGALGSYAGAGGAETKRRLLELEGALPRRRRAPAQATLPLDA